MSPTPTLCKSCGRPIRDGEHRWAGREPEEHWHYACAGEAGLTAARRAKRAAPQARHAEPPVMFTHERLWGAIEELARRHKMSLSRLAVLAGLDATALNRSKRIGADGKPRWPSSGTIAQLLQATGTSLQAFGLMVEPPDRPQAGEARAEIVLVDDSAEVRAACAEVLRGAGYHVRSVASHRELLDLLDRAEPIDLLCTDIVMPDGLGGVALARLARARRPTLQILYMTGYDIPKLTDSDALTVLRKPIAPQNLLAAVEQALAPRMSRPGAAAPIRH